MDQSPSNPSPEAPAPIAEIDHGPSKFEQFLENNQTKLVILAILIALGVVAYVIQDGLNEAQAQEAGAALQSAESSEDYLELIKTWPGSNAAASALPLLAESQWADSQEDAIATLNKFITSYPEHSAVATAKVSLGLRLLEQGKTAEASEILTEVADNEAHSYIAPLACIVLGDAAKAEGKNSDAAQWYERAQQEQSGQANSYKEIAAARLLIVNAAPPEKIKPSLPEAQPAPEKPSPKPPAAAELSPLELEKPDAPQPEVEQPAAAAPVPAPPAGQTGQETE